MSIKKLGYLLLLLAWTWAGVPGAVRAEQPKTGAKAQLKAIYVQFRMEGLTPESIYRGEVWVTPPKFSTVQAGERLVQRARAIGVDTGGLGMNLNPTWTPSDPQMVTVTPGQGPDVTLTVLKAGRSEVLVSAGSITKKLTITAEPRGKNIYVEITQ